MCPGWTVIESADVDATAEVTVRAALLDFPDDVFRAVDQQLRAFGLEVVLFARAGDAVLWTIEPRG
jgi:hypothetical protein